MNHMQSYQSMGNNQWFVKTCHLSVSSEPEASITKLKSQ